MNRIMMKYSTLPENWYNWKYFGKMVEVR